MQLRTYQVEIAKKAASIINKFGICYLNAQVRTGKTLSSLEVARLLGKKEVLFVTKIKAFSSIQEDYINFGYDKHFVLHITNKESLHKFKGTFDFVILDEAHAGYSAYPKPGKYTKLARQMFYNHNILYLSGTPASESYSMFFHQLWISKYSPFNKYQNFYKWVRDGYVNVKQIRTSFGFANCYDDANYQMIMDKIGHILITFTQEEAGFSTKVTEHTLTVEMKPSTYALIDKLKRDLVVEGKHGDTIMADTAVKLQSKLHQLFSGTIKTEEGKYMVLDKTKAEFILKHFAGKKIGIYYKFIAERNCLQEVLGDRFTDSLDEFNSDPNKWFCSQFVSGREGISLRNADALIMYNVDFSYISYAQSIERMSTLERSENNVYWIFSKNGIEQKVYKVVTNKSDYTNRLFRKDFGL